MHNTEIEHEPQFQLAKDMLQLLAFLGKFMANIYRDKARFYFINRSSSHPYYTLCILRADYLWVETISSKRRY